MTNPDTENDLVIGTSAQRILVRIKADGTLIYGPDYTPDEAARVLWETLARRREAFEQAKTQSDDHAKAKEVLFLHMQKLLLEAGKADLANQIARDRENELTSDPRALKPDKLKAHLEAKAAEAAFQEAALRLVELGRRMALRGAPDPISPDPRGVN